MNEYNRLFKQAFIQDLGIFSNFYELVLRDYGYRLKFKEDIHKQDDEYLYAYHFSCKETHFYYLHKDITLVFIKRIKYNGEYQTTTHFESKTRLHKVFQMIYRYNKSKRKRHK